MGLRRAWLSACEPVTDNNSPMVNISGLEGAAPLWGSYMQAVYSNGGLVAGGSPAGWCRRYSFARCVALSGRCVP